ncbi:MAG: SCO family protein [Myxococcota bacterium]
MARTPLLSADSRILYLQVPLIVIAAAFTWLGVGGSPATARLDAGAGYTRLAPPLPLPDFELESAPSGNPLRPADLAGAWTLLAVGFASCPDICPNTLSVLSRAAATLWPDTADARVLFVSVDPERDDVERLGAYAGHFGPHVRAATGTHPALRELTHPLGLFYARSESGDPAHYAVEHATSVLVIDPDGAVIGVLSGAELHTEGVITALRSLLAREGA